MIWIWKIESSGSNWEESKGTFRLSVSVFHSLPFQKSLLTNFLSRLSVYLLVTVILLTEPSLWPPDCSDWKRPFEADCLELLPAGGLQIIFDQSPTAVWVVLIVMVFTGNLYSCPSHLLTHPLLLITCKVGPRSTWQSYMWQQLLLFVFKTCAVFLYFCFLCVCVCVGDDVKKTGTPLTKLVKDRAPDGESN